MQHDVEVGLCSPDLSSKAHAYLISPRHFPDALVSKHPLLLCRRLCTSAQAAPCRTALEQEYPKQYTISRQSASPCSLFSH